MSYDIYLIDPVTKETLHSKEPHELAGGTYLAGGTTDLWLNVTWNYGEHFRRVLGEEGIRSIYEKTGAEAIVLLDAAIDQLGDDATNDYWEATEGNAKQALCKLRAMAQLRPDGVFRGD